jgi:itaconate CoA-transferase
MDAVPAVGEHTDAILAELGYAPAEVADLRAAGAV